MKSVETRKKTVTDKVWHDLVGPPPDFSPQTKLPQNKAVLRRHLALRNQMLKENLFVLELVDHIWAPARIYIVSERLCKLRIKVVIEKFIGYKHHTFSGGRNC